MTGTRRGATSRATGAVLLAVCVLLALWSLYLGANAYLRVRDFQENGVLTTARVASFIPVTISDLDEDRNGTVSTVMMPMFQLVTESGEQRLTAVAVPVKRKFQIGDEVRVRYLRSHPEEATLEGTDEGRTTLWGTAGMSLFFCGCGAVVLLRWRAERRRTVVG